jgi:hypothetical protein
MVEGLAEPVHDVNDKITRSKLVVPVSQAVEVSFGR